MSQPGFSFHDRVGLLFTVEAAFLSICAVTVILLYALFKWVRTWGNSDSDESEASDSILFLNLMFADLIQGMGTTPNLRWMNDAKITEGKLCTAQAVLKQVGINGVALTSLAIALYTFIVLRRERPIPEHTAKVVVVVIWTIIAIVVGIPNVVHKNDKYYGATTYWCWIKGVYLAEQISTEYLWVWLAGFVMLVLYSINFFQMRGCIGKKKAERPVENHELTTIRQGVADLEGQQQNKADATKKVAQKMLYYPAIYIACFLPNSISRWMFFLGRRPSPKCIFAANTIFCLSGLFNFILFFITRPSWVVGDTKQGERRPRRVHGLPPSENSRPSSPQDPEKKSNMHEYYDYSQQPHTSLSSSSGRQLSSNHGFLPPGH